MKKKFISILLIISMIYMPLAYAMEERTKEEVKFKNRTVHCSEGQKEPCESTVKRLLCQQLGSGERESSKLITSSADRIRTAQIRNATELSFLRRKERAVVKDQSGRIIFDTKEKQRTNNASLNDDDNYEIDNSALSFSSSFTTTCGDEITLKSSVDDKITLKSAVGGDWCFSVSRFSWSKSQLVKVVIKQEEGQSRCDKDKGKVFLEEKPGEIKLLNDFFTFDEQKKLLDGLSIVNSAVLLANLEVHGCIKAFGHDDFDDMKKLLKNKIRVSLQQQIKKQPVSKDVSYCRNEINWLKDSDTWSSPAERMLEDAIKDVIRPVGPKVLFECATDAEELIFNSDKTKFIVPYENGRKKIRGLENGEILFEEDDAVQLTFLNSDGTWIGVEHEDGTGKIVDLAKEDEDERVLLKRKNIKLMRELSPDKMSIAVVDKDGNGEIIRIADEVVLWQSGDADDVEDIWFHSDGTMLEVSYEDGRTAIIRLEDGTVVFEEDDNVAMIELNQAGTIAQVYYEDGRAKIRNLEDEEILFEGNDVKKMHLSSTEKEVIVEHKHRMVRVINLKNKRSIRHWGDFVKVDVNSDRTKIVIVREFFPGATAGQIINFKDGKILSEWDDVKEMELSEDSTKIIIHDLDDKAKIINWKNGKALFERDNAKKVYFSKTGNMVIMHYKDDDAEIIDSENGETLFKKAGIIEIDLDQADMKAVVHYEDDSRKIIDLKNKVTLFAGNDIAWLSLNLAGTRALVRYESNKMELIDPENYNRGIALAKLEPKQLRFIFSLKKLNSPDTIADFIDKHCSLWRSFKTDLKQKLLKSYFSKETGSILLSFLLRREKKVIQIAENAENKV